MQKDSQKTPPVNVREVFKNKNPRLAGMLPGFIFRYLERIVHQKEINDFLDRHGEKTGLDFVHAVIDEFDVKLTVKGIDNIPPEGRYIFASNHPLGGFDGLLLMSVLEKKFKGFKVLVNDILMNIRNLHPLFIPINKHGRQDLAAARTLDEVYQSDLQLLTFPAGFVSRRIKGVIVDLIWKKNFISKSIQYQRDIVPVFVSGRNSEFFYRLGTIRRSMGIKLNLEMFYLVDETFKHRHKSISIIFGEPVSYTIFDKSRKSLEWARWMKEKVYALNGIENIPV